MGVDLTDLFDYYESEQDLEYGFVIMLCDNDVIILCDDVVIMLYD